jgi:hypothetical protein
MNELLVINVRLVGLLLGAIVLANFVLPVRYGWRAELRRVSPLARQVFWSHYAFIVLILAMLAALCLGFADQLVQPTSLGLLLAVGMVVFWGGKLVSHVLCFDSRGPRGERIERVIHHASTAVFLYFTATFAWVAYVQGVAL